MEKDAKLWWIPLAVGVPVALAILAVVLFILYRRGAADGLWLRLPTDDTDETF